MLESLFVNAEPAQRLRQGPLGSYLDSYATSVRALGYTPFSTRVQLWLLAELGQWMMRRRVTVADLDDQALEDFFVWRRKRRGRLHRSDLATVRRFVEQLRGQGAVPSVRSRSVASPRDRLEGLYERFLREERGLTTATVVNYRPVVHRFLIERFGDKPLRLRELTASDISAFILRHARSVAPRRAQLMTTALRSFLRFLLQRGKITADLAACVPTVANWRLAIVPKHLSPKDVERVLEACDRRTAIGRRDHAILLLLARLGLRASEIVKLQLDDIDWRAGEITVRGKGSVHDRLPLMHEVGEVLAAYVRHDRPRSQTRRLFIRSRAPLRGLGGAPTVSTLVRRALERADLDPPTKGAHLLRFSLATSMLRGHASMAEIGELLRHRSLQTTEIYAKVDIAGLRGLAQAWPGCGGGR